MMDKKMLMEQIEEAKNNDTVKELIEGFNEDETNAFNLGRVIGINSAMVCLADLMLAEGFEDA